MAEDSGGVRGDKKRVLWWWCSRETVVSCVGDHVGKNDAVMKWLLINFYLSILAPNLRFCVMS